MLCSLFKVCPMHGRILILPELNCFWFVVAMRACATHNASLCWLCCNCRCKGNDFAGIWRYFKGDLLMPLWKKTRLWLCCIVVSKYMYFN